LKKLFNIIYFLFICKLCFCQVKVYRNIKIEDGFSDFKIDHYGFMYQIKNDNLLKMSADGNVTHSYSNKLYGDIFQLDVSNPLRPLLFYRDQGLLITLDNTLSEQESVISLNEIGLYQAKCIANSNFDNGIWLYDIDMNEIIKIDNFSNIIYRSGNLSVIFSSMKSPVVRLYEKNRKLYAVTEEKIFVLDQFGALIKIINTSANKGLIISENSLLCYDGKNLKLYDDLQFKVDTIQLKTEFIKVQGYTEKFIGLSKNLKDVYFLKIE